jgi:hypothetical protein
MGEKVMHSIHLSALAAAVCAGLCLGSVGPAPASAALVINVDTAAQQYYLSGSASGTPGITPIDAYKAIGWYNGQPTTGGDTALLSPDAFSVSGNTIASPFHLSFFDDGGISGQILLDSDNTTTLTAIPTERYDYSSWSAALQAELESNAAAGEALPATNGSSSFGMTFAEASLPEPTGLALLGVGAAGLLLNRRRLT